MAQDKGKIALIVNTASYERVVFALGVATAAAALGQEVSVLFGHGGLIRLKKGFVDVVGEETTAWMREQIQNGVRKGGVSPVSELLQDLHRLGGKVYACPVAMGVHNIIKDELIEEVDGVRGVTEFIRQETHAGSTILYV